MKRILIDSSFAVNMRELMDGITLYIRERHAHWQIYHAGAEELLSALHSRPDGALTLLNRSNQPALDAIRHARIPVVNMLRNLHPDLPSAASDHLAIGSAAASYFLSRGFKHFAFVGTDREWSDARAAGFSARLLKAGYRLFPLDLHLSNDHFRHVSSPRAQTALRKSLRSLPTPIALFAAADYIARPILEACQALHIIIPDQLSLLGVDNDPAICDLGPIPLSSIPQNFLRIGFEAARLLDGLITKRRHPKRPLWIPPRDVVVRRSTDFIAADDPHVAAALRLIHAPSAEIPTVKLLLQQLPVSRQWLDLQFKLAIGHTASEEIRRLKLTRAKDLLLNTHLSVHEIARRCGFAYAENLTRFLHDKLHLSPRQLRTRQRFTG